MKASLFFGQYTNRLFLDYEESQIVAMLQQYGSLRHKATSGAANGGAGGLPSLGHADWEANQEKVAQKDKRTFGH